MTLFSYLFVTVFLCFSKLNIKSLDIILYPLHLLFVIIIIIKLNFMSLGWRLKTRQGKIANAEREKQTFLPVAFLWRRNVIRFAQVHMQTVFFLLINNINEQDTNSYGSKEGAYVFVELINRSIYNQLVLFFKYSFFVSHKYMWSLVQERGVMYSWKFLIYFFLLLHIYIFPFALFCCCPILVMFFKRVLEAIQSIQLILNTFFFCI